MIFKLCGFGQPGSVKCGFCDGSCRSALLWMVSFGVNQAGCLEDLETADYSLVWYVSVSVARLHGFPI